MKNLFLITMLFITTIATAQETLTVNNNTVKILGHKAVHYVVTDNNKTYIGEHLPILFKVENKTKWIEVVYNDNKKSKYLLEWNKDKKDKNFIEPNAIPEPLVIHLNKESSNNLVIDSKHKPILEVE